MLLGDAEVLLADCQSTGANPRQGALLEVGWAPARAAEPAPPPGARVVARLVALPEGAAIPSRVTRITGVDTAAMAAAVEPDRVWRELVAAAGQVPGPLVIHFARFEEPFLRALHLACAPAAAFPFEIVCTHEIARRLLPELPRRGLRALAGYFGFSPEQLRRSAGHVAATAVVWSRLVAMLDEQLGVRTLEELRAWLAAPAPATGPGRAYPMPRATRLALPDRPGVYRMLRGNGDVLYVGKARSLRKRVNGYFQKQSKVPDRTLEMLTQARDLEVAETATALEAALLEVDEIKRLAPPYNVALVDSGRPVWFASPGLRSFASAPDARHRIGPLLAAEPVAALAVVRAWLAGVAPDADAIAAVLGPRDELPEAACVAAGVERLRGEHGLAADRLLGAGAALWVEWLAERAASADAGAGDDEDPDEAGDGAERPWDAERVHRALRRVVRRAAHAVRRARWTCALSEASLVWGGRALIVEGGAVVAAADVEPGSAAPPPPGAWRGRRERQGALTRPACERLRVLTTELRRVAGERDDVELCFGRRRLRGARLRRALRWI